MNLKNNNLGLIYNYAINLFNFANISIFFFCLSALFADVVNCMQTDNLELKKLVYLYLMNYAKTQPDVAIISVNTFVRVSILALHHVIVITVVDLEDDDDKVVNFDSSVLCFHSSATTVFDL